LASANGKLMAELDRERRSRLTAPARSNCGYYTSFRTAKPGPRAQNAVHKNIFTTSPELSDFDALPRSGMRDANNPLAPVKRRSTM
jgi:hypothetical protein